MKSFKYSNRPRAYITVKLIERPYEDGGEDQMPVVSVGCTLKSDFMNPTWKVHIPIDLADAVGMELIHLSTQSRPKALRAELVKRVPRDETPDASETDALDDRPSTAIADGRVIRRRKDREV